MIYIHRGYRWGATIEGLEAGPRRTPGSSLVWLTRNLPLFIYLRLDIIIVKMIPALVICINLEYFLLVWQQKDQAFIASSHASKGNHKEVEVVINAHAHGAQIPTPPENNFDLGLVQTWRAGKWAKIYRLYTSLSANTIMAKLTNHV